MSELLLDRIQRCFEGAIPAVIATAGADGIPNVTYLSRVRFVDRDRIALSNQFFSKTARNLAENPRASVLVIDPLTFDEFRLTLAYERTEKRGPVFDQLRADLEALAAFGGPTNVFKLRAADIYRVIALDAVPSALNPSTDDRQVGSSELQAASLVELTTRLTRCADLDTLVATTVDGLAELFDYQHSALMLLDETGTRLYTIASHGYQEEGVGSEVVVGEGIVGMAAARGRPIRLGNLRQLQKYANTVRAMSEDGANRANEIPVPVMPIAQSRIAIPAMAFGQVVGVLVVESDRAAAFDNNDEGALTVIASLVGSAVEAERTHEKSDPTAATARTAAATAAGGSAHVRFYREDGSTFLDGDYLIKGVAGRILWALLSQRADEGRTAFTNREVRLDPTLELPEFRDNFESRLILLKRRLDECHAPIRIEKTGRGRFELIVDAELRLEAVDQ